MKLFLLLATSILLKSNSYLALGANVYASVWCFSEQANSTALTSLQYSSLIDLAEMKITGELKRQRVSPPAFSGEHNGKARDEDRRDLIDCTQACKIYGYNFCVNILGCPGRRFMIETQEDDHRDLATMKDILEVALPDVAQKALAKFASDATSCDKKCADALLTAQCQATVDVV